MHTAVQARSGGRAGGMWVHSWRGWLQVGVVVLASDRRQGLIQTCKQLGVPWMSVCVPVLTLPTAHAHCSEGRWWGLGCWHAGAKLEDYNGWLSCC